MTQREHMIGPYRLQPDRGLLLNGAPIPIGVKALDILTTLVEAGGALVTKDELMARIWPEMIVEEHNLHVHISALRKALGPDAGWILTVPRLGYRFDGPTAAAHAQAPPPLPQPLNRFIGREGELAAVQS